MGAKLGMGALKGTLALALLLSCSKEGSGSGAPSAVANAAAADSIRSEARAFYRDLAAHDNPALLTHFWPAKIAARWEPPFQPQGNRPGLLASAIGKSAQAATAERCIAGEVAVARWDLQIEGRWARAMVPRCAGSGDELWFLDMNGSWKMVRLVLGDEG